MAKYLIDSNIFLEILLHQQKQEKCKEYLNKRIGNLAISDFSLHSIGIILFKLNKANDYDVFLDDILPKIELIELPVSEYKKINRIKFRYNLDFDDSYQTAVASAFDCTITTIDNDFRKIAKNYKIEFIE